MVLTILPMLCLRVRTFCHLDSPYKNIYLNLILVHKQQSHDREKSLVLLAIITDAPLCEISSENYFASVPVDGVGLAFVTVGCSTTNFDPLKDLTILKSRIKKRKFLLFFFGREFILKYPKLSYLECGFLALGQ